MKLAIVGSVSLMGNRIAADTICSVIERLKPTIIVSGGAVGIDQMGVLIGAEVYGLLFRVYLPKCRNWGGYKARNLLIANDCDYLVRIISSHSRTYGSGWTRDRAAQRIGRDHCEEFVV